MTDDYVERIYRSFAVDNQYVLRKDEQVTGDDRLSLATACKRPELRPLLKGVVFEIDNAMNRPFVVEDDRAIRIGSDILHRPVVAAFHLRHSLEISALKSALPGHDSELTSVIIAVAAFHAAAYYLDGLILQESEEVLSNIPAWMGLSVRNILSCGGSIGTVSSIDEIRSVVGNLLPLQGMESSQIADETIRRALELARRLLPLAKPVERILTTGGDNRMVIDVRTGLNQYGCSPRPRPWAITFSSCTASSISDYAYQEAERLRQDLMADALEGNLGSRCDDELEAMRREIGALMSLDLVPGTEIILTPSGTDGELYALYLAMGNSKQGICNILVSSTEIGSGAVEAASGRHFDTLTPLGEIVRRGDPVEGFATDLVDQKCLELRHENGVMLSASELDNAMRELVEEALSRGKRVLAHLLDCSKTGIGGPSIEVMQELKRKHPSSVEVVVDAAQMRLGKAALLRYVESEFMVLITGSKFFTGPPFAGALIVSPSVARKADELEPLPQGMRFYGATCDLPRRWRKLAKNLSPTPNLGMLLRWKSALWEMRAFYSVSALDQFNTINHFGQAITGMIKENPDLDIVMAPPHERGHYEVSWDQLPSIFTFLVYKHDPGSGTRMPLTYEEARFAYQCVNMDIARFLPVQASDREHGLAAKRCHIGQPVRIRLVGGEWIGALRIAAGARLVSGVKYDDAFGSRASERLDTEVRTAGVVFSKLSVIVKYWDDLIQIKLTSGATLGAGFYIF